jgi:hypothetical protein
MLFLCGTSPSDEDAQVYNTCLSQLLLYIGWLYATCFGLTRRLRQANKAQNKLLRKLHNAVSHHSVMCSRSHIHKNS